MKSWLIFHVAFKKLDKQKLWKIWRRSTKPEKINDDSFNVTMEEIRKWTANPDYSEEYARNPLDRMRLFLDELDNVGQGEYARAAINYMAEPLGGEFTLKKEVV